jgi:hypothetical protein
MKVARSLVVGLVVAWPRLVCATEASLPSLEEMTKRFEGARERARQEIIAE